MERIGDRGFKLTGEEWGRIIQTKKFNRFKDNEASIIMGNAGGVIRGDQHLITVATLSPETQEDFQEICILAGIEVPGFDQQSNGDEIVENIP